MKEHCKAEEITISCAPYSKISTFIWKGNFRSTGVKKVTMYYQPPSSQFLSWKMRLLMEENKWQ